MTDDWQLAPWSIRLGQGAGPDILDGDERLIASVHGSDDEALQRAMLLVKAPTLLASARACIDLFRVMRQHGTEREKGVAEDMLPSLEAAVFGLEEW